MSTKAGTMTNEERLRKTIRLEKTDKILSGPAIQNFVATYTGSTVKDLLEDDRKAAEAYERTFNELGGWDIISNGPNSAAGLMMNSMTKVRLPGRELPDDALYQYVEDEVMLPEDYDVTIENGWDALMERLYYRMHPDITPEERERLAAVAGTRAKAHVEKWQARGLVRLIGGMNVPPFDRFSLARSMAKFAVDLRRMPDKVKAAMKASLPGQIAGAKQMVEQSGCPRVFVGASRGSATFINARQFEEFVFPSMLEIVYALTDADIDVVFHLDCDWTAFLPYFKEFPRGRCLMQLDGATDIFKAKEILRDHMALMGDVPPGLLAMGTPEEVTAYCRKLIEVVGDGGGFILNSGCETPINSKPENVLAMVRAGNELTWN